MEVIVHLPDTAEAGEELIRTVTRVHADLVAGFIHTLPCTGTQKCEIIKSILAQEYGSKASKHENH